MYVHELFDSLGTRGSGSPLCVSYTLSANPQFTKYYEARVIVMYLAMGSGTSQVNLKNTSCRSSGVIGTCIHGGC